MKEKVQGDKKSNENEPKLMEFNEPINKSTVNVSTFNRFSALDEDEHLQAPPKSHEIELVIDSHGNGLIPAKIYKKQRL